MKKNGRARNESILATALWIAALGWFALNILRGLPQVDEPIYIIKAKQVASGTRLYRDAAWTQAPLFPYIFAPMLKAAGYTLVRARIAVFVFTLAAMLLAWPLIRRELPGYGGAILWAAVFLTPLLSYELILAKHHSLKAALALSAIAALRSEKLRAELKLPLSMAIVTLIGCIRINYFAAPPALFIYFMIFYRKKPLAILLSALAGAAVLAACFAPFVYDCFGLMKYDVWSLSAGLFPKPAGGAWGFLLSRAHYLKGLFIGHFSISAWLALLLAASLAAKGPRRCARFLLREHWLLAAFALPLTWTSVWIFSANPQDAWFMNAFIVWGVASAAVAARLAGPGGVFRGGLTPAAAVAVLFAANFAINFPFGFSKENPLASIYRASELVDRRVRPGEYFFSCQLFEGMGSRGKPLPASELSVFGYPRYWGKSEAGAEKYGLLTQSRIVRALERVEVKAVLITDFYCPDFKKEPLKSALENNYAISEKLPYYGQGQADLRFYVPK